MIVATDHAKSDEVPGVEVGPHLARHGIEVDVHQLVAADIDVASAILSFAADKRPISS